MSPQSDLRAQLTAQHELISVKLRAVTHSSGAERDAIFDDFRRYLAVHEAAEQSWMHPAGHNESADRCACDRHRELAAVAQSITALETLPIDSDQFNATFHVLVGQIEAHCDVEEHPELTRIFTDAAENELMMILAAFQSVPTIVAGDGDSRSVVSGFLFADVFRSACGEFGAMQTDDDLFF